MTAPPPLDDRDRLKRRNTAVAMGFGVVLCIVAIVMAVNSISTIGEGSEDPFGVPGSTQAGGLPGPASTPTDGATTAPPAEPAPAIQFSSPSGNIGCYLTVEVARCDIEEREWEPTATPPSCTAIWGQGLVVAAGEAQLTCARSSVLGPEQQLAYGRSISAGTFACSSSEAGMRCENTATGKGFSVSRKTFTVF